MIKGVLLDFDGTIANTGELILSSFAYAVRTCLGREAKREEMLATFGLVIHDAFFMFTQDEEKITEMRDVYRETHNKNHDRMIKIYPGVKEAFESWKKQGIKIGVVTSKKSPMVTHGLEILGLSEYVDAIVAADHVTNGKPDPEPMLMGLKMLGLSPEECVAIGDSPFDIMSGRRAGMKAYAVSYTDLDKTRFVGEGEPTAWIDSLEDL